ncbi:transmembrane protein, putative (macronuclear) [Tetrahymena thermophila SB210]|uniref:Transmembrane protein, putative n=1 Tax=Tetrahymena thermophila (strain SB210) TaxID=312017 RepID=Q234U5_TETTS|nr:transmembrane protein, putative [Tetrahymena thermophila SB210]EAR91908.2 transmembrane protein, putative [Tetrahymena thermophila SB210]|eukprot:XP_001012153.2 transmembrane protein, putative [Tetrahymena thermophila SB210]
MDDIVCTPGQYLDSNNQTCSPCPQNCTKCLNTQQCLNCVTGFNLINAQCFQLIANCKTYLSATQCVECVTGYIINHNQCLQQIANCQNYLQNGQCSVCISGYTLVNNQCFQQIANCQNYQQNGQCSVCISGYSLVNNQCFQQIAKCQNYQANGQCSVCISGYTLVNNQCFQQIANCQNYQVNGQCSVCVSGYIQINGLCFQQITNCQAYQTNGQCSVCDLGYVLSQENQCTQCQIGSFYDKGSNNCLKCDVSCKTCEGTGINQCTSCFQDATLTSGFCQYCQDGFYYDLNQLDCFQCDKSCKTCKGGSNNDCLSCETNFNLDTNHCKVNQGYEQCQNITTYDEYVFEECFQGYKFAQLTSICLQFLILSSILLSFLLIYISPASSPVNWCYLQIQQLIGNYIFTPYINILLINHYHLKYIYMNNIFNIIPNIFSQNSSTQFNLNLLNTFINVQNISDSYSSNCFYQIIIFLLATFISIVLLIKQRYFSKAINWVDRYINWNYMIGALRLISNFIIFNFFLLLSQLSSLSIIDYCFFSAFAIIYSLFHFLLFSKLKTIDQYSQNSNLQLISLAYVGTGRTNFLQRIFWIGFEFRKLIIAIIQGALLLSSNQYKSVPWIHFVINIFYLLLILKYRPFVDKNNNLMLTLMEIFHILLIFQISMITNTNNEPQTLEQPFLQNNKNSQVLFGYIFIALISLFVISYMLFCIYILIKHILQNTCKRRQMKTKSDLNITINQQLSSSNMSKTVSQNFDINHLEQKEIQWTRNPLNKNFKLKDDKQVVELSSIQQF